MQISDFHCIEVNPLIIERKNSYVILMDHLLNEDIEQYTIETERYMDLSTQYARKEKEWINMQTEFLRKPDVKKYTPKIILEGEQLLIEQRDAEMKSSLSIIKMGMVESEEESQKLIADVKKYNTIAEEKEKTYWELVEEKKSMPDLREWFISFPESRCPEQNLEIPDTMQDLEDLLNPPVQEFSPIT